MKFEDAVKIVQKNGYHLVKKTDKQVSESKEMTPEEKLEEAKKIAKTMPKIKDETEDNSFKDSFNPIVTYQKAFQTAKGLTEDYAKYKKWHTQY